MQIKSFYNTCFGIFVLIAFGLFMYYGQTPKQPEIQEIVQIEECDIDTIEFASYPYRISEKGKQFIKSHEDLRLTAYNDPSPEKQSIGWGHQIQPGENLTTITSDYADKLFDKDIQKVEAAANRLLSKTNKQFKYTQGFIDGLCSLVYNCGEYGVTQTTFYKRLLQCRIDNSEDNINEADFNYTLSAVKISRISCEGHKIRRANEYKIMIN